MRNPPVMPQELLENLHKSVPAFAERLLCSTYGWVAIGRFVEEALDRFGRVGDDVRFLEGARFRIEKRDAVLTVFDKSGRGEILQCTSRDCVGCVSPGDLKAFAEFSRGFPRELRQPF